MKSKLYAARIRAAKALRVLASAVDPREPAGVITLCSPTDSHNFPNGTFIVVSNGDGS